MLIYRILRNNKADVVHVAREFLRDPNFVQKVALSANTEVTWVDQYHRAPSKSFHYSMFVAKED